MFYNSLFCSFGFLSVVCHVEIVTCAFPGKGVSVVGFLSCAKFFISFQRHLLKAFRLKVYPESFLNDKRNVIRIHTNHSSLAWKKLEIENFTQLPRGLPVKKISRSPET